MGRRPYCHPYYQAAGPTGSRPTGCELLTSTSPRAMDRRSAGLRTAIPLRVKLSNNRAVCGHIGMDVHRHRQHADLHLRARPPGGSIASGRRGRGGTAIDPHEAAARQHNARQSPSRPRTRRHLPAGQAADDDTAHQGVTHHVLIDTVEVRGAPRSLVIHAAPLAARTSTASLCRGASASLPSSP